MSHKIIKGHIRYTSRKPEMMDRERGREDFIFTVHDNGLRTLMAHCEIDEPDPRLVRDVVYSVDSGNHLLDAFVRLNVGGEFMGAGFFRTAGNELRCDSYGPDIGSLTQKVDTCGDMDSFNTHPISVDSYNLRSFDLSCGPGIRRVRNFLPSLDHRGASPPVISGHHILLEYVGEETIRVAAGQFDARRFRFVGEEGDPIAHPPYDVWVTADDDCLFLRGIIGGRALKYYELVSLEVQRIDLSSAGP